MSFVLSLGGTVVRIGRKCDPNVSPRLQVHNLAIFVGQCVLDAKFFIKMIGPFDGYLSLSD